MSERTEVVLADVLHKKGYIRGPFGSALKRPEMKSEGIPVYEQQQAIYNTRDFRFFIDEKKFEELKRFQVETNDLVISCSGTVGKVTIIREDDPKGIISQALLILRADSSKVLPEYLKYFFASREGYNAIVSRSSGSVQVNISKREVIEQIPLSLPSLIEQEKIVGVLKTIDDKIENNNQINRNLSEQAQALYKSWFVDCDWNDGVIPDTWAEVTIEDLTSLVTRGITPKYNDDSDQIVINQKCIRNHIIDLEPARTHTPKVVNEKWIQFGDLLINSTGEGTLGRAAQVMFTPVNMTVDTHVTIVRPATKILVHYIGQWGLANEREIEAQHTGSTGQTELPRDRVKAMKLRRPGDNILIRFNDCIAPMMEQIVKNQEENARLVIMRDSLLPKLMSGELDVSELDI